MKNKGQHIVLMVILLLIVSGVVFWGGIKYQQQKLTSQFNQRTGLNRGTNIDNQANRNGGFRQTIGEILNADDKSVTVKLSDGSSKIVLISDSTTINQSTPATKTDLKVGIKVAIMGDVNTDGSITGRTINLNPQVLPSVTPAVK